MLKACLRHDAEMLQRLATMQPPATMADVEAKGVHAFMRIDKAGS